MIDLQKKFHENFNGNILIKPIFLEKKGEYFLTNDIIINFNPVYPSEEEIKELPSLRYGFFAGILIIGENIELNLLGHEIKMSHEFSLRQRFFSIIELTNSPFPLGGGLPLEMTRDKFKTGKYIYINNGRLGLSSHSSIHGNENRNITISKLKMYDFEVGGIMLNGGKHISICKCNIGPNFQNLWVNAKFSAATQLVHHFYNVIVSSTHQKEKSKEFLELEKLIEETINAKTLEEVPLLFRNKEKVIDGTVYGISLHKSGVAIGGHGEISNNEKEHFGFHYILKNISIENLVGNVEEKISYLYEEKPLRDISGQIIDIASGINNLVKVQLETKEWLKNYPDFPSTFYIPDDFYKICLENIHNNNTEIIEKYIKENFEEKLGRDIMLHVNKGVIGLRIDGINSIRIENLSLENIKNISSRVSPNIKNLIFSNMEDLKEYTGNDTIGCCINNCHDIQGKECSIENLISNNGTTYGMIIMNLSKHVYFDNLSLSIDKTESNKKQYGVTIQDSVEDVFVKV